MKSLIDYSTLLPSLVGASVPRPNAALRGTLSGHAAGEPFEKLVYERLKADAPSIIYKQYEFLNDLFRTHPSAITEKERLALFHSPIALFLLSRGKAATESWSPENPFQEKQNDTADILAYRDNVFELLDVKTRNLSKHAQPPNIISAYKLAQMCALMFDNQRFEDVNLNYVEVAWEEQENATLVCKHAYYANLFKTPPSTLYINWAAAMQIQFHVAEASQTFDGTSQDWAQEYLRVFVASAKERCRVMYDKYIRPFRKYL